MTPISIQLYTVRQYFAQEGELEVLSHIARAGFDAVEPGNVGDDASAYLKRVQDLGMTVSSCFGPIPDDEHRTKMIETALALEVSQVVCGFWTQDFDSDASIQRTADLLGPAVEEFAENGLDLCLHNHWFEFEKIDGRFAVDKLLDACPGLKLELDIYWAAHFGDNDPVELTSLHRDIIPLMHVKDGPLVKGEPHTALGKGKVDIAGVIKAADPSILKWLVLELDECGTDMWEAVEKSAKYLKGLQL